MNQVERHLANIEFAYQDYRGQELKNKIIFAIRNRLTLSEQIWNDDKCKILDLNEESVYLNNLDKNSLITLSNKEFKSLFYSPRGYRIISMAEYMK